MDGNGEFGMDLNEDDASNSSGSHLVRKNIPLKLKQSKSRGRGRKPASPRTRRSGSRKRDERDHEDEPTGDLDELPDELEFSTMKTAGPASDPLHHNQKLKWDHKVNMIGTKVVDPLIHCCETCTMPILIYGRMIPCKHVFCFDCAKKAGKHCPRCKDPVNRIEQSALGTVFVCTYGGSKHGTNGCHRTYLSQRDLQAHIDHRHLRDRSDKSSKSAAHSPAINPQPPPQSSLPSQTPDPFVALSSAPAVLTQPPAPLMNSDLLYLQPPSLPPTNVPPPSLLSHPPPQSLPQTHLPPPVVVTSEAYPSRNTNLITVPIQDESDFIGGSSKPLQQQQQPTFVQSPNQAGGHSPYMTAGPQRFPPATGHLPLQVPPTVNFSTPPPGHPVPFSTGGPPILSHPPPQSGPVRGPHPTGMPPPVMSGPPPMTGPPPNFTGGPPRLQYDQPGGHQNQRPWGPTGPPPMGGPPRGPPTSQAGMGHPPLRPFYP